MARLTILLALGLALASIGAAQTGAVQATGARPQLSPLSTSSLTRSGRLVVHGSGFGAAQGTSKLLIGGRSAPVTRWSDTLIVGYVPEATPLGQNAVQVAIAGALSNPASLEVTARQSSGRVKWRFQVDAQVGYLLQRPAVGPDGTVVAHDPAGNVYALDANGGLKWIFNTGGFAAGPPSIGADGTVYAAASSTIFAISSNGALKWTFTEPAGGQGVIVGPTVGPDGNIYAVTDIGGIGALALSPKGRLLWSNTGNPIFSEIRADRRRARVRFRRGPVGRSIRSTPASTAACPRAACSTRSRSAEPSPGRFERAEPTTAACRVSGSRSSPPTARST